MDWITLSSSETHSCGLRSDGSAWCWGENEFNQLGDGSGIASPTPVAFGPDKYVAIATMPLGSCAVRTDSQVVCWGDGSYGQLGASFRVPTLTPVR
jgi:alpha-tubulin suppressor-like RCC1 family protein